MSGNLNSQLNNGTLGFYDAETIPIEVNDGTNTYNAEIDFNQSGTPGTWNWTITDTDAGTQYGTGTITLDANGNVTGSTGDPVTIGGASLSPPTSGSNVNAFAVSGGTYVTGYDPNSQSFSPVSDATSTSFIAFDGTQTSGNKTNCKLTLTQGTDFNTWDWAIADANTGATYGTGTLVMDSATGNVTSSTGQATLTIGGATYGINPPTSGQASNAFTISDPTGTNTPALLGIPNTATFTPPTDDVTTTAYDALGDKYSVDLAFTKNSTGSWGWDVKNITDSDGNTYTPSSGGTGSLQFGDTGALPSGTTGIFSFAPTTGDIAPVSISLDFSGLTQDDANGSATVESQDGYTSGTLQSYTIDQTGTITGSFSNGVTQSLGQIALADFTNNAGLASSGSNLYTATANSGSVTIQPAGTGSLGTIDTGTLEASNVDLSQEMSNMIIAQSGFDANSKVITTDDELMQTLVNMIQG
jgi:flagellar hook protein FlgE